MKRLAQFLRSVLPVDPWQLVFLTGVIFLFICPRLPWRPSTELLTSNAFPLVSKSDMVMKSTALIAVLLTPITFAGLVAYFACFYPSQKPVRRLLWLVFVPAIFSLGSILFVLSQIFRPPSSVFRPQEAYLPLAYRWFRANVSDLPLGIWFLLFSLALIAIFFVRLHSGTSSLPLALPGQVAPSGEANDLWPKIQILIFTFLAPLFLIAGFIGVLLGLPLLFSHGSLQLIYGNVGRVVASVLEAALLIVLALWILGPWGRNAARRSLQLPEPQYALVALLLPILISGLLQVSDFLIDRTQWAIYFFNQNFPPQIASYFDLSRLWDPWLLLMIFGAFAEEIVFRGLLLRNLISRYGFHRGIFLTGVIWGAYHFRGDSYYGLSAGGVIFQLVDRILFCLAMNYVLSWMTLRWKSIIPASIAHTVSNIIVVAGISTGVPWSEELRIVEWAVIALLLFHYWPLVRTEPGEAISPRVPLESAM